MKIRTLFLVVSILLIASLATAQIPCGPTITPLPTLFVNWPQYHYDAAHSGCNPYESILSPDTVGNLVVKWEYAAPNYVTSPVIVNGVVYIGSGDHNLYAVNVYTGKLLWQSSAYGPITGVVSANGMVYVGVDNGFGHGAVYAFDAGTGGFVWVYYTAQVSRETNLAVANGVLYAGEDSGDLEALNAKTGEFLWKSTFPTAPKPAVAGGVVYVAAGEVYALDAGTGSQIWSYSNGYDNATTPAVVNGVVYVALGVNYVVALNAKTGALIWKSYFDGYPNSDVAVANGVIYLAIGVLPSGQFAYIAALNASTGDLIWQYGNASINYAPVLADGVVYFASSVQHVYAVAARSGTLLGNYAVDGFNIKAPAVVNGVLYVSADDNLYAFGLPGH